MLTSLASPETVLPPPEVTLAARERVDVRRGVEVPLIGRAAVYNAVRGLDAESPTRHDWDRFTRILCSSIFSLFLISAEIEFGIFLYLPHSFFFF